MVVHYSTVYVSTGKVYPLRGVLQAFVNLPRIECYLSYATYYDTTDINRVCGDVLGIHHNVCKVYPCYDGFL